MRKFSKLVVLSLTLVMAIFLASCQEKIELNFENESMTMTVGDTETLVPVANKEGLIYEWTSGNTAVLTVNAGVVTAVSAGTTTVTVKVKDKDVTAEITITVNPVVITFAQDAMTIAIDQEITLTPTVVPAQSMSFTWTTSAAAIATVTNGVVKGIAVGTATITASGKGGSDSITITVVLPDPTKVAITGASSLAKVGDTMDLNATVLPSKASQEVIWSVNNETLATVSNTGLVTFLGIGQVVVTATSSVLSSQKGTVSINIIEPDPMSITVSGADGKTELELTKTLQMSALVSPDLADQSVTWSTSDLTIAFIDEEGLLTAVKVGTVDVIATSIALGSISGSVTINVVLPTPEALNVTIPETVLQIEETMQLSTMITPALANQLVSFASSNEAVATVSETGLVSGVSVGTATITITSQGLNSLTKTYEIKIVEKLTAPTHDNVIVDSTLVSAERYSTVTYDSVDYIVGQNAFSDLSKIVTKDGMTINVKAGTYSGNLTVANNQVAVLGPNANIDPNTGTRVSSAILTGKLTINASLDGIIINGFDFTGNGSVYGNGTVKNVSFMYNKVYDTTENVVAWAATRNYNLVGFFTFWKQSNVMENFIITNNAFSNVSGNNIMIGNILNLTLKDNTFIDFDQDAVRIDGGYNSGLLLIENNDFSNTTLSAYNGLYLRSLGAAKASANPQVVTIINNHFKNIGQPGIDFSGAISTNSYQEYGITIDISHNIFETCTNYLWVRNNATSANHASYPWVGKVEYNAFLGEPLVYYHRNRNTTDTEATNPALIEFAYNFFGDASGEVITLDMNKFFEVKSITNNFNALGEMNALYVDLSLTGKTLGEEVVVNGLTLKFGERAFVSINDALTAISEGGYIIVLPGTYAEDLNIVKNNVTIAGNNAFISPNSETRNPETILTGTMTLGKELHNLALRGLKFIDSSKIINTLGTAGTAAVVTKNLDGFLFTNNVVETSLPSGKGFLTFLEASNSYSHHLSFVDNYFTQTVAVSTLESMLYIDNCANVMVTDNVFENLQKRAVYFHDMTKGLAGNALIQSNVFKNIGTDALWVNWLSPLPGTVVQVDILNNTFENVGNRAFHLGKMNNTDTYLAINVSKNSFKTVNVGLYFVRVSTGAHISATYNKFLDIPTTAYYNNATDTATTSPAQLNATKNLFMNADAVVVPEVAKVIGNTSVAEAFASLAEYEAALLALLG
ncbi:MAG: Ig-like domain-containing protein [Bacilli bacterium]